MKAWAVAVLAAAALLALAERSAAAPPGGDIPLIAVDAVPQGNGPRTVARIDECVTAAVGQPVEIDIVLPPPGVPAQRGIAAYQFSILYDPAVVWVQAEDTEMLLEQAAGSQLFTIADPKPDTNGYYISWGVDFGPIGIEPEGASEIGPGVISRLTLLPRAEGTSKLTLTEVKIIDDASQVLEVLDVRSGWIAVGGPCPGTEDAAAQPPPTPTPPPTATPAPSPTPAILAVAAAPTPSPEPDPAPAAVPEGGGPPDSPGNGPPWPLIGSLAAWLGAAALLIARPGRGRPPRPNSSSRSGQ